MKINTNLLLVIATFIFTCAGLAQDSPKLKVAGLQVIRGPRAMSRTG